MITITYVQWNFEKQLSIWTHLVWKLSLNKKDNSDTKKENNSWKDTFIALEYKTVQMSKKIRNHCAKNDPSQGHLGSLGCIIVQIYYWAD